MSANMDCMLSSVRTPSANIIKRGIRVSNSILCRARGSVENYLSENDLEDSGDYCFIAVGSVGRGECLEASDLDFIPVAKTEVAKNKLAEHDQRIRDALRANLGIEVSKGEDLTKLCSVNDIVSPEKIGGNEDSSGELTKRLLILTESRQIAGGFSLSELRRNILNAYAAEERSSGRHALSLCNDVARYFRTLCIEYKAKLDVEDKDWCTRNTKLRHSRKLWYFSTMISIISLAQRHPRGRGDYTDALLDLFDRTPVERLHFAIGKSQPIEFGRLIESYAFFLDFMSNKDNRVRLARVDHAERYQICVENPFPALKHNSDVMHSRIMLIIQGLEPAYRQRIFDWFLL